MSKADLIQQIAGVADGSLVAERGAEVAGDLDPRLFLDDALNYFDYDGGDDRSEQAKFLIGLRDQLARRRNEFEQAGYRWHDHSLVMIDKILRAIDALLLGNRVGPLCTLLRGEGRVAHVDDKVLPAVADKFDAGMTAAGVINDAIQTRKYGSLQQQLDALDQRRTELAVEVAKVGHPAVKRHLETWVLRPVVSFTTGPACTEAREILANMTGGRFRESWKAAKKRAETTFAAANSGSKDKLSNHIKFESDFGATLDKLEKAKQKGKDHAQFQAQAIQIGTEYLKELNRLPEQLRQQTPDFFHPLQRTLAGIVASLQANG